MGDPGAAPVDAQRGAVGLLRAPGPVLRLLGARGLGPADQPVRAHEGDELGESHHDAQQSPQHRPARHNDMTHIAGPVAVISAA